MLGHAVWSEAERRTEPSRKEGESERASEREREGAMNARRLTGWEAENKRRCAVDSPTFLGIQTDCTHKVAPLLTRYKTTQSTTPSSTNHNPPSKHNQFKRGHTIASPRLGCR